MNEKTNSNPPNPLIPLAGKKIFKITHNLIMLNIENNDPFLAFSLVLSYSHKPTKPCYTFNVTSFKITKEKKFRPPNSLIL
jgi:hypothetical protein